MRGGEGASGTDGAGTCDWRAVRVKGFNLAPLGWEEASGGAKLHSLQSPHRQCLWLPHLRLIKPTLSDEQASDFMSEMLRRRRWLRFRSESLGSLHICCPQRVKFSHHLPLEMVVGRVSTGWFIRLRTPHSSFFPLHLPLDWWSVFLLLHVEPNLERVTELSGAAPKRQRGAAVDNLKEISSSTTAQSKWEDICSLQKFS